MKTINKVIHKIIKPNGNFPNNSKLPFLIYKGALDVEGPETVERVFRQNHWKKLWRNGIFSYHHYHSNTHEVLGIYSGKCQVEMGGPNGEIFKIEKGDVIIIPVGVSHKKHESSSDFKCIGAYPTDVDYDMNYGKPTESHHQIKKVPLPETDPVYGKEGPLFDYWK